MFGCIGCEYGDLTEQHDSFGSVFSFAAQREQRRHHDRKKDYSAEAKCAVAREGHPCCSESNGKGVKAMMISMASSSFLPRALLAGVTRWLHGGLPAAAAFPQFKDT